MFARTEHSLVVFERVDRGYVSTTTDNHYSNVLVAKRYSLHVAAAHQVRTTTAPATAASHLSSEKGDRA
jgi:hypothetical protein